MASCYRPPRPHPQLVCRRTGARLNLSRPYLFVGSSKECDLHIPRADQIQAVVQLADALTDLYVLTDLSDMRDTRVNGVWLQRTPLCHGDVLDFGDCSSYAFDVELSGLIDA